MSDTAESHGGSDNAIHLHIGPEYYRVPLSMTVAGITMGMFRGGRKESWRYLAENAHRAPTTVKGWYLYQRTKNYRVLLGALRGAGVDGARLGGAGVGWVVFEQLIHRVGLDDVRELGAGMGTAGIFAALYRLPWRAAGQCVFLGFLAGTGLRFLRLGLERDRIVVPASKMEDEDDGKKK